MSPPPARPAHEPPRIACVWIPDWPIQRRVAAHPPLRDTPILIYGRPKRQKRQVLFCNQAARQQGIRIQMPLVEVPRSFAGQILEHDPVSDRIALQEQLPACQRFSPQVGIDTTDPTRENLDSIFLDLTRTFSLLGGLPQVLADLHDHFQQQGFQVHIRHGQTLGQAWALAHSGQPASVSLDIENETATLPLACLPLDPDTIDTLEELGVQTIGQVLDLPRASLPARFGHLVNQRLSQLQGQRPEQLVVYHPDSDLRWTHRLEHPSGESDVLQTILCLLLRQAVASLSPRRLGILSLSCRFLSQQPALEFHLQLVSPTIDIEYLLQLLQLQMERTDIPCPQSQVELTIHVTGDHRPRQQWLFQDERDSRREQRSALIERLSARLGNTAVQQLREQSQALPERRWVARKRMTLSQSPSPTRARTSSHAPTSTSVAPEKNSPSPFHPSPGSLERPSRLYQTPRQLKPTTPQRFYLTAAAEHHRHQPRTQGAWVPLQFSFAKTIHTVAHAVGPERIESQWWEGQWIQRDYFRIQTETGQRFWIFRQAADRQWYIHGDFA